MKKTSCKINQRVCFVDPDSTRPWNFIKSKGAKPTCVLKQGKNQRTELLTQMDTFQRQLGTVVNQQVKESEVWTGRKQVHVLQISRGMKTKPVCQSKLNVLSWFSWHWTQEQKSNLRNEPMEMEVTQCAVSLRQGATGRLDHLQPRRSNHVTLLAGCVHH